MITAPVRDYSRRDRMLATQAATSLLLQLLVWLALFHLGFALVLPAFDRVGWPHALAQAGSSLLPLGYAGPTDGPLTVVDYLGAATGLVVVALQIGYLPALYSAFNRRETAVTLLVGRAGTPAWGPEILGRTRDDDGAVLDELYLQCERWAVDLPESHTHYPVLLRSRFRWTAHRGGVAGLSRLADQRRDGRVCAGGAAGRRPGSVDPLGPHRNQPMAPLRPANRLPTPVRAD